MIWKKVFLDIGAGKDFERARKVAKEHQDWLIIAIDPDIPKKANKAFFLHPKIRNLALISRRFEAFEGALNLLLKEFGNKKVDIVESNYIGPNTPPAHPDNFPGQLRWLLRKPSWLSSDAKIYIRIFPYEAINNPAGFEENYKRFSSLMNGLDYDVNLLRQFDPSDWPITKDEELAGRKKVRITLVLIPRRDF